MTWWSWKRGIKSAGWRAGKVGRSDLVKCIITAVNSDGTYDVRRAGIADDTADIKRVASIAKIDSFAVGDIASLGFADGDRQKPFLWGFINGGAKHISVVVNPLPVPPEPEMGEPSIPYLAPTTPIIAYTYTVRWDTQILGVSSPRPPLWSWFEIVGGGYDIVISCNKSPLPPEFNPYYRIVAGEYGSHTSNLLTQGHSSVTFTVYSNQPDYLTEEWDGGTSEVSQAIQNFADQYIAESPYSWGGTTDINETPFFGFEDYLTKSFDYYNNYR